MDEKNKREPNRNPIGNENDVGIYLHKDIPDSLMLS
jgi:hypothetical protein